MANVISIGAIVMLNIICISFIKIAQAVHEIAWQANKIL